MVIAHKSLDLLLLVLSIIAALIFIFFNQLDAILFSPLVESGSWCSSQPCMDVSLGSWEFVLVQPSSTVFVYLLGIIAIVISISMMRQGESIQYWWGIALILWGSGALLAGTSYQAFAYEIKCAGREYCLWTSWWEIAYMVATVASVNAMMIAMDYHTQSKYPLQVYARLHMILYFILSLIGSVIPSQLLISFELMVVFLLPNFLIMFFINLTRYRQLGDKQDLVYVYIWLLLGLVMILYFSYLLLGITEVFWKQDFWFSENDVLHIGLIVWMLFIQRKVRT